MKNYQFSGLFSECPIYEKYCVYDGSCYRLHCIFFFGGGGSVCSVQAGIIKLPCVRLTLKIHQLLTGLK